MTNEYEVLQCFVSKLHFFVSKLMARDVLVWFTAENSTCYSMYRKRRTNLFGPIECVER